MLAAHCTHMVFATPAGVTHTQLHGAFRSCMRHVSVTQLSVTSVKFVFLHEPVGSVQHTGAKCVHLSWEELADEAAAKKVPMLRVPVLGNTIVLMAQPEAWDMLRKAGFVPKAAAFYEVH